MALWLCRLDADGLDAARSATDQARRLGIGAWVLPLQSGTELDAGLDRLREVYGLDGGLPLLRYAERTPSDQLRSTDRHFWCRSLPFLTERRATP